MSDIFVNRCFLFKFVCLIEVSPKHSRYFSSCKLCHVKGSVCVCVCLYVCVYLSFNRKGFARLNETVNVMLEVRSAMVSTTFVATSKTILAGTFKLETVQKNVN